MMMLCVPPLPPNRAAALYASSCPPSSLGINISLVCRSYHPNSAAPIHHQSTHQHRHRKYTNPPLTIRDIAVPGAPRRPARFPQ
jgi:hypothetical protein